MDEATDSHQYLDTTDKETDDFNLKNTNALLNLKPSQNNGSKEKKTYCKEVLIIVLVVIAVAGIVFAIVKFAP